MNMARETFTSRLGFIATMIGVAVGLGNVWRFPYMVGRFGGAAFVLVYLLLARVIGVPALRAEWSLGRHTRRGSVGAFEAAGFPGGRKLGWLFFLAVTAATGYYSTAIGWVVYHALAQSAALLGSGFDASAILPPEAGFSSSALTLQLMFTSLVILGCLVVLLRGLRSGIERVSTVITPLLFMILVVLVVRGLTLPGGAEGVSWFLLKFEPGDLNAAVVMAALGRVVFSLALGGTFMVVYGSYLEEGESLRAGAVWTVLGDTGAGLLAGLAIFPAVFALGLEPGSGPGLIFETLPRVFERMPAGHFFGLLFFTALAGAAYLSAVAAFEVLVVGLMDNTNLERRQAAWLVAGVVLVFAVPPMINLRIFIPWDLTFGTGFQTFGAFVAALTVGWALSRGEALRQLSEDPATEAATSTSTRLLYLWIRFVVPGAILAVGTWWLLTEVLGIVGSV
jgi:NSS family neurotransmitter:Na+ symporter